MGYYHIWHYACQARGGLVGARAVPCVWHGPPFPFSGIAKRRHLGWSKECLWLRPRMFLSLWFLSHSFDSLVSMSQNMWYKETDLFGRSPNSMQWSLGMQHASPSSCLLRLMQRFLLSLYLESAVRDSCAYYVTMAVPHSSEKKSKTSYWDNSIITWIQKHHTGQMLSITSSSGDLTLRNGGEATAKDIHRLTCSYSRFPWMGTYTACPTMRLSIATWFIEKIQDTPPVPYMMRQTRQEQQHQGFETEVESQNVALHRHRYKWEVCEADIRAHRKGPRVALAIPVVVKVTGGIADISATGRAISTFC